MLATKKGKLFGFLNQKIKCCMGDTKALEGTFLAFDRHMNLVLSGAELITRSVRTTPEGEKVEVERKLNDVLPLVFVRGETVTSIVADKKKKKKKKKKDEDGAAAAAAPSRKRDRDASGVDDLEQPSQQRARGT